MVSSSGTLTAMILVVDDLDLVAVPILCAIEGKVSAAHNTFARWKYFLSGFEPDRYSR